MKRTPVGCANGFGIPLATARLIRVATIESTVGFPRDSFARKVVLFAGSVSTVAWGLLAWRSHAGGAPLAWMLATMMVVWAALLWALWQKSQSNGPAILGFALGFRLIACFATPVLEDDHHRFLWDGYRFATTGDPYAKAPQAHFADDTIPPEFRAVLDDINHPDVPTVYGPLTEWAFRLGYAVAPARLWPWKLILLEAELTIFAMLWPVLSTRGRLLLAWCPLAIFETGFNAHPDILAIALVVGAWWLARKSRPLAAGAVAGLAVAAKVFALLLLPFLLWRQGRRSWAMAAAAVVALYGPFWWRGSAADFAGLRAMAGEWEFNSSVFAVVAVLLSRDLAQAICALTFGVLWLALFVRWTKFSGGLPADAQALPPGEWVYGGFLLLSATVNPWYCLWLGPFVAARPSTTGVCALAAVSLAYLTGLKLGDSALGNFEHPAWLRPLEFGIIGVGALWDCLKRKPAHEPTGAHGRVALPTYKRNR